MSTIKIGGQDRPVAICWGTLKEFGKLSGRKFADLFSVADSSFEDIEALIFVSLKYGAKKEGVEFKVKQEDIAGWLDESMAVIPEFMEIFQQELSASLDSKNR